MGVKRDPIPTDSMDMTSDRGEVSFVDWQTRLGLACGGAATVLGLLVITGWAIGSSALVQVIPTHIAMRFNTAVCFVVAGVGLMATLKRNRTVAFSAAAILVLFAGTLGMEFLTSANWGSDRWLRTDTLGGGRMSGRMHETTAAGFFLTGLGLSAMWIPVRRVRRVTLATLAMSLTGGLGLVGAFGNAAHLSTISGGLDVVGFGMAIHTAAGFVLLGLGGVVAFGTVEDGDAGSRVWRAPVAGLVVLMIGLVLWQALVIEDRNRISARTEEVVKEMVAEAGFRAELALVAVEAVSEMIGDIAFSTHAAFWMATTADLEVMALLEDSGSVAELVVGTGGNPASYRALLEASPPSAAGTEQVGLPDGTRGLAIHRKVASGWVTALVGSQALFTSFNELHPGYVVEVLDEDSTRVHVSDDLEPAEEVMPVEASLPLAGLDWTIRVSPSAERLAELGSPLPELSLTATVIIASLVAASVHLATTVDRRRREAEAARRALADEVDVRRKTQADLESVAERLARSNRELQEFAFVASHDLQEPLRKIRAFGDRLNARLATDLDEKSADYLRRMTGAAERMQTLINDLLAFSRLTSRAQPFERVDLALVVSEVEEDLELSLSESGGRVEADDLPTIDADPIQMRQLFQNLIGNAIKYRHPARPPVVRVGVAGQADEGFIRVTVQDNGIGFEPEQGERIFQLFQRLHGRGEFEGTGMGLAIARRITERHGGSLEAHGSPGQGSTFVVRLPTRQRTEEA